MLGGIMAGKVGKGDTITAVPLPEAVTWAPLIESIPVALIDAKSWPSKPRTIAVEPGKAGGPVYPHVTARLVVLATV